MAVNGFAGRLNRLELALLADRHDLEAELTIDRRLQEIAAAALRDGADPAEVQAALTSWSLRSR
jgi:hypothetical protein